ncbi:MAG TPA: glycerate kinase [Conexibacter sp.]
MATERNAPAADGGGAAGARARWLVAPDSFKGTFTASEVTAALADGLREGGAIADVCPVADGGEGTLAVLLEALGGTRVRARAHDPLGRPVEASYGLLANGRTAIVETAEASGLGRVSEDERDAEAASSAGTGELIVAAARAGAQRILVAVGGSATTDGGVGAIAAIHEAGGIDGVELQVLCDTREPFERAAEVFGPQKGADAAAVARLSDRLQRLAATFPRDPRAVAMGGCAGGLSGGLWAFLDAQLRSGADAVLDAVGFDARAAAAGRVVTGEGRLDAQSAAGKLVSVVARRAHAVGAATFAVVGQAALTPEQACTQIGLADVLEASTLDELRAVGARLARRRS